METSKLPISEEQLIETVRRYSNLYDPPDKYYHDILRKDNAWEEIKKKLKLSHYTPRRRFEERRYSCYSFSTSALDGGDWSASRPGRALAPEKDPPVPIVQGAGWAPEPVWTQRLEEKSFRLCRGSNLDRP
jgi:hypothetical protein